MQPHIAYVAIHLLQYNRCLVIYEYNCKILIYEIIFFVDRYEVMDFNRRAKKRKLKEMFDSNESLDLNGPPVPNEHV